MYQTIYKATETPQWLETTTTILGLIIIFGLLILMIAFVIYYFLKQYKKDLEHRNTNTKAMNEMYRYYKKLNDLNEEVNKIEDQEENGQ